MVCGTFGRQDLRFDVVQESEDVVNRAYLLIEQRRQQTRKTRTYRNHDGAYRVAPESRTDQIIYLLDAGHEHGFIVGLIEPGNGKSTSESTPLGEPVAPSFVRSKPAASGALLGRDQAHLL